MKFKLNGGFDSKGQVSSPFELFVAIIIMSFVVIIGSQMLMNANSQVCMSSVDKSLSEFKGYIENTANNKASSKFVFAPQDCYNEKTAIIQIQQFKNEKACAARCPYPSQSCFVLVFNAPDIPNGFNQKCLDLPTYTSFLEDDCAIDAPDLEGYEPRDPRNGIMRGSYILRNTSAPSDAYPKLCTYYDR